MTLREPDYDELRDAADERRRMRWSRGCLCGYPDMPGSCPGPATCPMHGEQHPDALRETDNG